MIAVISTSSCDKVPVIICDECHKEIEDIDMAIAAMPASKEFTEEIQQVLHVHKANCFDMLEKREGEYLPWLELHEYLLMLSQHYKVTSHESPNQMTL